MKNSKQYAESFQLFLRHTDEKERTLAWIVQQVKIGPGTRVLDIGAGDGTIANGLRALGAIVTVIEPNPELAAVLHRKGFSVIQEGWETAKTDERFDVILAIHSITYFPDHAWDNLVDKMYTHLVPGGTLIIVTVDQDHGSWREFHEAVYRRLNIQKRKTSMLALDAFKHYRPVISSFSTHVRADQVTMKSILRFDFTEVMRNQGSAGEIIEELLEQYRRNKVIELENVHQGIVITQGAAV